jgi:hypothetical protein
MKKIEISRWDVIDIFFKAEDEERVNSLVDEYIKRGWRKEAFDSAGGYKGYDYCIQLMKFHKKKTKQLK